jgi:flagellar protein FlaG
MQIESRIPEMNREVQFSAEANVTEKRQRSVTSGHSGDSTRQLTEVQRISSYNGIDSLAGSKMKSIDVHKAVEELNEIIHAQQRDVSFSVNEEANATVIQIFKTETGELIKQFPPEEILAMIIRIRKNIGLLVDSKA